MSIVRALMSTKIRQLCFVSRAAKAMGLAITCDDIRELVTQVSIHSLVKTSDIGSPTYLSRRRALDKS